ncbi:MAG: HupE/UreJ family protein [Bdellovibrionales bacterium]
MAHIGLLILLLVLCPQVAHAHGIGGAGGLAAGLKHPVLGLDHLLAMISVGIVSTQLGGRAVWMVPATFVFVMGIGGLVGMQSFSFWDINVIITIIEQGIICSVIILGLAIAFDKKVPIWTAMLACGFFGFFHGFAHGVEIPSITVSLPYIVGFMTSTAALHLLGVAIVEGAKKYQHGMVALRYAGAAIFGIGLHIEYELMSLTFGF